MDNLYEATKMANEATGTKEELIDSSLPKQQRLEKDVNELNLLEEAKSEEALIDNIVDEVDLSYGDEYSEQQKSGAELADNTDLITQAVNEVGYLGNEQSEQMAVNDEPNELSPKESVNRSLAEMFSDGLDAAKTYLDRLSTVEVKPVKDEEHQQKTDKIKNLMQDIASIGYMSMYQAPKQAGNIADFMVNLPMAPFTDKQVKPFTSVVEGAYNMLGIGNEEQTYNEVQNLIGRSGENPAQWTTQSAKLLGSLMAVGGFMNGANSAMGIKSGWFSTEKSYDAYMKAKLVAETGAEVSSKTAGAASVGQAIGQGVARTGVAELATLGTMYDNSVEDTIDQYINTYKQNPEFSWSLLLGGTAFDSASTLWQSSKAMNTLHSMAVTKKSEKLGNVLSAFSTGSINSDTLATASSIKLMNKFDNFEAQTISKIDELAQKELIPDNFVKEAKSSLKAIRHNYEEILNTNLLKVGGSNINKNTVNALARNNTTLFLAADKLQSYKTGLTPKDFKSGLSKTTLTAARSKQTKFTKNQIDKTMYVVDPDGSVTLLDDYKPTFGESANTNSIKIGANGLYEYMTKAVPTTKGRYTMTKVSLKNAEELTANELPAYTYLVAKNGNTLANGLDKGKVEMVEILKSMDSAATKTGFGANAMADLINSHPSVAKYLPGGHSAEFYRTLADTQLAKTIRLGLMKGTKNGNYIEAASKLGYKVNDITKFAEQINSWDGSSAFKLKRGEQYGVVDAGWSRLEDQHKLIMTVDNKKLEEIINFQSIEAYNAAEEMKRNKLITKISDNNDIAGAVEKAFFSQDLIDTVSQVDKINSGWLPKPLSNLFQKNFGYNADNVMKSAQLIAEQSNNILYSHLSKKFEPLRESAKKLSQDDIIKLNKFKHLVQGGFDITPDFQLRTVTDEAGNVMLTTQNEIALRKYSEQYKLIPEDIAELIRSCESLELPDLTAVNAGEPLFLSANAMDFLHYYNDFNKDAYNLRQSIGQIYGKSPTRVQDFYMSRKLGEYVNFIYDQSGTNLLKTITGHNPEELLANTKQHIESMKMRNPVAADSIQVVSLKEAKDRKLLAADEDWLGWVDANGDFSKLKYNSGRLDRTSVTDAFEFDPNLVQTLYDDLLKRSQNSGKLYVASKFNKEIQYANQLIKSPSTEPAVKERLKEYMNLLHGRSQNTSEVLSKLNGVFDEIADSLIPANSKQLQKQAEKSLKIAGETEALNRLIVQLPKAKATGIIRDLQAFTSWSLVRFARFSQVILNAVGLVPMSHLATSVSNISKFEDAAQYAGRIGLYGVNVDQLKKIGTMDWGVAMAETTKQMFTKDARDWAAKGIEKGLFSADALLYRDIMFEPTKVISEPSKRSAAMKLIKKTAENINKAGTYLSDKSEELSRVFAFTMGRNLGKRLGLKSEDQLLLYAKNFMDKTVANYSALNKPNVYRGTLGSLLGTFKTYKLNVIQQLLEAYSNNPTGLATSLGVQTLVAGTNSLPFAQTIEASLFPAKGNEDGMTKLTELCGGNQDLARAVYYGLPALVDLDISSRSEIDPVRGGFLPLSSQLSLSSSVPFIQSFQKMVAMGKEIAGAFESDLPMPPSRWAELIGTYSPIGGISTLARLGSTAYDDSGEEFNYRIDRDGNMERVNSMATMLGFNSIKDAEDYRINNRIKAREAKYAADMNYLKKNLSSLFRFSKNGGSLTIDTHLLATTMEEYMLNGGNPETFYQTIWNWYNQATVSKRLNQIKLLGNSKDIQGYYDLLKIMSIENGALEPDSNLMKLNDLDAKQNDFSNVSFNLTADDIAY